MDDNNEWYLLTEKYNELVNNALVYQSRKKIELIKDSSNDSSAISKIELEINSIFNDFSNNEIFKSKKLLRLYIDKYSNYCQ